MTASNENTLNAGRAGDIGQARGNGSNFAQSAGRHDYPGKSRYGTPPGGDRPKQQLGKWWQTSLPPWSRKLEPNAVFNQAETLQRRQEAMANVEPVRILKGQIIIQDGQPVTHEQIEILRAAGLLDHRSSYKTVVGAVLLSLLLAAFVTIYLFQFRRRMFQNERQVATICLVVIVATLLSLMVKSVSGYLMPVGAATMLLTILLGPQVALVTGTALGLFLGMLTGNDLGSQ